jgi:hypothetical protein
MEWVGIKRWKQQRQKALEDKPLQTNEFLVCVRKYTAKEMCVVLLGEFHNWGAMYIKLQSCLFKTNT